MTPVYPSPSSDAQTGQSDRQQQQQNAAAASRVSARVSRILNKWLSNINGGRAILAARGSMPNQ